MKIERAFICLAIFFFTTSAIDTNLEEENLESSVDEMKQLYDEFANKINDALLHGVKSGFIVRRPATIRGPLGRPTGEIKFTRATTNIGGHYDTATGRFTCHYPGVYAFILHMVKSRGSSYVYCVIRKNRSFIAVAWSNPNGLEMDDMDGMPQGSTKDGVWYGSSSSVVLHLAREDIIDLGICSNVTTFDTDLTSFSGFLLKED